MNSVDDVVKEETNQEQVVMTAIEEHVRAEIASRQAEYRYQKEYEAESRKKHDEVYKHREILLRRRKLSTQDLETLVAFAKHFRLLLNIEENLGKPGYTDRRGLMISISEPPF